MDYQRIYDEFIADRWYNPVLSGYTERHHIIPRCLGGSDAVGNLIDLTPEDHYFAHLLLAKIHGGQLAAVLFLLVDNLERQWEERIRARPHFGAAKRMAARLQGEAWEGELNPLFNARAFDWINYRTNETRCATLHAMHKEFGASRPSWTSVANGSRPSLKGWRIKGSGRTVGSEKGQKASFINRDGRTFRGTQGEFARVHGINLATASRVAKHDSVTRCGWRRKGVSDRPHNYAKDGLPAHQKR